MIMNVRWGVRTEERGNFLHIHWIYFLSKMILGKNNKLNERKKVLGWAAACLCHSKTVMSENSRHSLVSILHYGRRHVELNEQKINFLPFLCSVCLLKILLHHHSHCRRILSLLYFLDACCCCCSCLHSAHWIV